LFATAFRHEIRSEFRKLLEHAAQSLACRTDADLIAHTFDFDFNVIALVGKISRDANRLRIAVLEHSGCTHL